MPNFAANISMMFNEYDFLDRFRKEHSGTKKSIGLTRIQGFNAMLNNESGLVETNGPLIENNQKMLKEMKKQKLHKIAL